MALPHQRDTVSGSAAVTSPSLTAAVPCQSFPTKNHTASDQHSGTHDATLRHPPSAEIQCTSYACVHNADEHAAKMLHLYSVVTGTITFLKYWLPAGYEGPMPTHSLGKHLSAHKHNRDVAAYIRRELSEGVWPLRQTPCNSLVPNQPLLTFTKKDSNTRQVTMDLSWALPPKVSINGHTPREFFLGQPRKIHLLSVNEMCALI